MIRSIVPFLLSVLLASCATPRADRAISCNAPQGAPDARLLLFGEMHGSAEAPALIGALACERSRSAAVAVALEIPTIEQAAIDRFLASDAGPAARASLISGNFWTKKFRDGRSSDAMAALIEQVHALRTRGAALTVVAFDRPSDPAQSRDASMAQAIREFLARHPDTSMVALMGNIHASSTPMERGEETAETTASLLQDLQPISVLIGYRAGTIWACMPECGVHPIDSKWFGERPVGFIDESPWDGYSMSYIPSTITASLPAVEVRK